MIWVTINKSDFLMLSQVQDDTQQKNLSEIPMHCSFTFNANKHSYKCTFVCCKEYYESVLLLRIQYLDCRPVMWSQYFHGGAQMPDLSNLGTDSTSDF